MGDPNGDDTTSLEEEDQLRRSTKRNKAGEDGFSNSVSMQPRVEEWMTPPEGLSFKDILNKHNREYDSDKEMEFEAEVEKEEEGDNNTLGEDGGGTIMSMGDDGLANFTCNEIAKKRICGVWRNALIVKLLGKKLGVMFLRRKLQALWSSGGPFTITDIGNDYYVVRFDREDDMEFVLTEGPWLILGHYLCVQKWEPKFKPWSKTIGKVTAWVRLPDLPMESYDKYLLKSVGNHLGKMLKVDTTTVVRDRGRFARVCVELDLTKPLQPAYKHDDEMYKVEYEGLYLICFGCGRYGHNKEQCPLKHSSSVQHTPTPGVATEAPQPNQQKQPQNAEETSGNGENQPEPEKQPEQENHQLLGPWMVVQRRRRPDPKKSGERKVNYEKGSQGQDRLVAAVPQTEKEKTTANVSVPKVAVFKETGKSPDLHQGTSQIVYITEEEIIRTLQNSHTSQGTTSGAGENLKLRILS